MSIIYMFSTHSVGRRPYFNLLDNLNELNRANKKKHILFICHSFQLMARYYNFAEVMERNTASFGIMPVHKTFAGDDEILFKKLDHIFYGADFRDYQVVNPNNKVINELGAKITAIEKERPYVKYERALMGVRISDEIVGLQFHPEADPSSMLHHLRKPERKEHVINKYSKEKYELMLRLAEDPTALKRTRNNVLPTFFDNAIDKILAVEKVS